jgi:hypothetical protein
MKSIVVIHIVSYYNLLFYGQLNIFFCILPNKVSFTLCKNAWTEPRGDFFIMFNEVH